MNNPTPLATTMAGTHFPHAAEVTRILARRPSMQEVCTVGQDALDEVRDHLARCTEAHQRGDMEAFHSAWHAEVAALMALGGGGDFFGAMGAIHQQRIGSAA